MAKGDLFDNGDINRSEVAKNDLENITHLADKGMINDKQSKQSLILEGSAIIVHSASCSDIRWNNVKNYVTKA